MKKIDLSQYFDDYPIIEPYIFSPTKNNHFQVLYFLLSELVKQSDSSFSPSLISLIKDLISVVPQYPSNLLYPLSYKVVSLLNIICPDSLIHLLSINPQLLSKEASRTNDFCKGIGILVSINQDPHSEYNSSLILTLKDYFKEENEHLISLFSSAIQSLLKARETYYAYLLINSCIQICPSALSQVQIEFQPFFIKSLPPLSFINYSNSSRFWQNIILTNETFRHFFQEKLIANLNLQKFALNIVKRIGKNPTLTNVLIAHRLSLSHPSAVDALIRAFAISDTLSIMFLKSKNTNQDNESILVKTALISVIASLLSSPEYPSLELLIKRQIEPIRAAISWGNQTITQIHSKHTFSELNSFLTCIVNTPYSVLYSHWIGDPMPSLNFVFMLNPLDPILPAIISTHKTGEQLISLFPLLSQVATSLMLSGPSPSSKFALLQLSSHFKSDSLKNFAEYILNSSFHEFIPSLELIVKSKYLPVIFQSPNPPALTFIDKLLKSDSFIALEQLTKLGRFLDLIPITSLMKFLVIPREEKSFYRFLVLLSSSPKLNVILGSEFCNPFFSILEGIVTNSIDNSDFKIAMICHSLRILSITLSKTSDEIIKYLKILLKIMAVNNFKTEQSLIDIETTLIFMISFPLFRNVIVDVSKQLNIFTNNFISAVYYFDASLGASKFPESNGKTNPFGVNNLIEQIQSFIIKYVI